MWRCGARFELSHIDSTLTRNSKALAFYVWSRLPSLLRIMIVCQRRHSSRVSQHSSSWIDNQNYYHGRLTLTSATCCAKYGHRMSPSSSPSSDLTNSAVDHLRSIMLWSGHMLCCLQRLWEISEQVGSTWESNESWLIVSPIAWPHVSPSQSYS